MDTIQRIRSLMELRGWKIKDLATHADMANSTLSNLFNRPYEPTVSTLEQICKGFGITMSEFFAEEGDAIALTSEQRDMLENWGKLTEEQKALSLALLKTL